MSERNLYEVTGDIKDINTLLVSREEWNRRAQPAQAVPASCGECGKKTSDGWALYCVACMEKAGLPAQAGQGTKVKEPHFAPQEAITEDGWTEWVCPKPKGYLAQCCDCGLVHEIDTRVAKYEPRPSENFEVVTDPDLQVQWRVRRRDDLRQEIWEIPAFEPDQTPDLEAGKSRFYSAQAGQVLTVEAIEAACDDADKNSEYSCGFYAGVRWYEAHLRAIARATHKEQT